MKNGPLTRWVTAEDIRDAAYGFVITDEDLPQISKLVHRAERLLSARVPRLEQRLDAGALSEDTVKQVVETIVLRVIRNPEGYSSLSTGGVSESYFRHVASGSIEILRSDLALLMPASRSIGSIRVGVPGWRLP